MNLFLNGVQIFHLVFVIDSRPVLRIVMAWEAGEKEQRVINGSPIPSTVRRGHPNQKPGLHSASRSSVIYEEQLHVDSSFFCSEKRNERTLLVPDVQQAESKEATRVGSGYP